MREYNNLFNYIVSHIFAQSQPRTILGACCCDILSVSDVFWVVKVIIEAGYDIMRNDPNKLLPSTSLPDYDFS